MTLVKMDGKLSTKQHDIAFQMKVFACKNTEFLRVPMKGAHKQGMTARKVIATICNIAIWNISHHASWCFANRLLFQVAGC